MTIFSLPLLRMRRNGAGSERTSPGNRKRRHSEEQRDEESQLAVTPAKHSFHHLGPKIRRPAAILAALLIAANLAPLAGGYTITTTAPQPSGCPQPNHWNLSLATPLDRQWSTSLPLAPATLLTVAAAQTPAQLDEIEQAISDSFGVW